MGEYKLESKDGKMKRLRNIIQLKFQKTTDSGKASIPIDNGSKFSMIIIKKQPQSRNLTSIMQDKKNQHLESNQ